MKCLVSFATEIGGTTMCKMSTHAKIKPQEFFTRFHYGEKHSAIGRSTAVWLHICPGAIKNLLQTFDRQCFYFINDFAATIISFARITFGIFICGAGTHGLQYL